MMQSNMTKTSLASTTAAAALAAYDSAVAAGDIDAFETAAHLLAAALRKPKAAKAEPPAADTLTAKSLSQALKSICFVIERRQSIPIMSNVRLACDGRNLALYASDLDCEVKLVIPALGTGVFDTTVPAHTLRSLVSKMAGAITLENEKAEALIITGPGGATVSLPTLPKGDFPVMEPKPFDCATVISASSWATSLGAVRPAVSLEETRYYLNGVFIGLVTEAGAEHLDFVATDGHRLLKERMLETPIFSGKADLLSKETDTYRAGVIIPRKAVDFMIKHAPDGEVLIELSRTHIKVTADAMTFTSKLIEGNFPQYQRVIPSLKDPACADLVVHDPAAAMAALTEATAISQEKSRTIRLTMLETGMSGVVRNMEGGRWEKTIPGITVMMKGASKSEVVGLNAIYLREALAMADGAPVAIAFFGPNSPLRVDALQGEGYAPLQRVGVLMPLRT